MKKMKKALAVILSLAMVLGMSLTSFAAPTETAGSVIIKGIDQEEGVTVQVYKIINYDNSGKYVPVIPGSIDTVKDSSGLDQLKPTAANIENLYYNAVLGNGIDGKKLTLTATLTDVNKNAEGNYVFNANKAGSWLIVVKGATANVYNPAIVSISREPGGYEHGTLNFADPSTFTNEVYVKKSPVPFTKEATTPQVNGVQYGDIIRFKITTRIPSYVESKSDLEFKISDTMKGLSLVTTGKDSENKDCMPTIAFDPADPNASFPTGVLDTIEEGKDNFTVDLSDTANNGKFLKDNGGKAIVLEYCAKVTSNAELTVDELTNTAKLTYSTDDGVKEKSDDTKHYTFGIDTKITGKAEGSESSGEFFKVDEKGNVEYKDNGTKKYDLEYDENGNPIGQTLGNAVFALYIANANGELDRDEDGNITSEKFVAAGNKSEFTTTDDGRLQINGLDSDRTYYLVETKAPAGYTVNATPVKVKVDATYIGDELDNYTVTIGEHATHYKFVKGECIIDTEIHNPYNFKNTILAPLPSTGGIGTTIFTIGGCAIMIIAAALFFASRRKAVK